MIPRRGGGALAAALLPVVALTLAACGAGAGAAASAAAGSPVQGGTLRLLGAGDVDHLDTASAYYTASTTLERAFTRQLFTYPASANAQRAITPVADAAAGVPTKANGGISADGRTYTVRIRPGVKWDTSPARQVTAQDFVRGFKRLCNPVSPVGAPSYYTGTIAGMKQYCDAFAKVPGTASAIARYIDTHDISGIRADGDMTLVFTLTRPANDFLNLLAMPFASAAPKEYMSYVPDDASFRRHTISDGPYQITKYAPNREIDLARNPAWSQAADPIRHQYVDQIQIREGQTDPGTVQQQIQAGTADLEWDTVVPTPDIPKLRAAEDPRLGVYPALDSNPFLVFNLQSPNNGKALRNVKVRRALEYAIDKVAIGQIYGGPALNTPLNQVIPPGNVGYQPFDPYPTPGAKGEPATCKTMLAQAGYPHGLTLDYVYRNAGNHPAVTQSVQADLQACGVTVKLVPQTAADFYSKYLSSPAAARQGLWDIAAPGWVPDWYGNNGRAIVEPLFDGRSYGPNSTDWGDYDNPAVNRLIDRALAEQDSAKAAALWHQADVQIMKDAPFIPFETQKTAVFHSSRVHGTVYLPTSQNYDITQVWLS
ncbi:ABC transporter substrate-binding protein [Nonomuraea sp. SYSU D8015]|uniref:ABC transporter substrate-binding protein n=1 Tax=Nonomuraea sp. SYSU D8015 TaxID=2593644 RepID=UPI001660AEAA|nr:ABC transporter substrate-binding protein [Nonomuraea sp. SYSU D8015]